MGGVSNPSYCAFAYRYSRDYRALRHLKRHLYDAAIKLAKHRSWPEKMRGQQYIHKLSWLALQEEHNWWWITVGQAWPRLIGIDEELWEHRVAEKYNCVRTLLDGWCEDVKVRYNVNVNGPIQ